MQCNFTQTESVVSFPVYRNFWGIMVNTKSQTSPIKVEYDLIQDSRLVLNTKDLT